ncbi:MAG: hypothetical protein LBI17_03755 [Rickettsiales bacterium]|jgi:hypothetical protein|nr:hypothetical protein [Rickettsiales bacterium]
MKKYTVILLLLAFASPALADNLFVQENKWEACHYYDMEKQEVIREDCEASKIKISSCKTGTCFFQASFSQSPYFSQCIMWGKLDILSDTHAEGIAMVEYRSEELEKRAFEDCGLNFDITGSTMKISIKSGCAEWCTSNEFEFDNTYHINNTGGAIAS